MNMLFILLFFSMFFSSIFSFSFFLLFTKLNLLLFLTWEMMYLNSNNMEIIMMLDWMTFLFLSVVFLISSLVTLYSHEYMNKNERFILLVLLFVISMLLFIISPNIVFILLGWDGLGITSFILIIFFQNFKSKNSGVMTVMMNRIGDIFIIFSSWCYFILGGLNFLFFENFNSNLGMVFVIIASMTKSAQMPFSSWLPAAMAAPTPVSSLVHSSTLVTAGIYLMMRFNIYMKESKIMMNLIFIMGMMTMFMSGIAANFETDLKKIIALSTLSQLGLMMMTLSNGMIIYSFFHLSTHALFKALLFLCAGVMIHSLKDSQDVRFMGKMINYLPITTMCFNMANLSLCGFPFLSGFYSKDLIIESFMMNNKNFIIYLILLLSTSLTVSYTFRLLFFLSYSKKNSFFLIFKEENMIFNLVLSLLTLLSILSGSILNWLLFYNLFINELSLKMKMTVPLILVFGLILSYFFVKKIKKMFFFSSLWLLNFIIPSFNNISYYMLENVFHCSNFGFFEYFGNQGIKRTMYMYMYMSNLISLTSFKLTTFFSMVYIAWN